MNSLKSSYFQEELQSDKYMVKLMKAVKKLDKMVKDEEIEKKSYKKMLKKCDHLDEKVKQKYTKIRVSKRDGKQREKDDKKKEQSKILTDAEAASSDENGKK